MPRPTQVICEDRLTAIFEDDHLRWILARKGNLDIGFYRCPRRYAGGSCGSGQDGGLRLWGLDSVAFPISLHTEITPHHPFPGMGMECSSSFDEAKSN